MKVVIVGGVAGGASTAARLRRLDENAQITVFERWGYVSYANCALPYFAGQVVTSKGDLTVQTPESFRDRFNIDARVRHEVVSIDREAKMVEVRNLDTGETFTEPYDVLVLSPGAKPLIPNVPGIESDRMFTVRTVEDALAIDHFIRENAPKSVAIVGAGFIGTEMAENLADLGIEVNLIQRGGQMLPPFDPEMASFIHNKMRDKGVNLRLRSPIAGFEKTDTGLRVLTEGHEPFDADFAILAIGVRPDTTLAKQAGLELGAKDAIVVDEHMRTSDPSIYAVGDAVQIKNSVTGQDAVIELAGPANREGRIAAGNISGHKSRYPGSQGSLVLQLFDLTCAATGINEKQAKQLGMEVNVVYLHPMDHVASYPGSEPMALKVLFEAGSGRVVGAQCIGKQGIDKHIDVLATAIRAGMGAHDLADLDLSYAPPYSTAKDPVNYAGFIRQNLAQGLATQIRVQDVAGLPRDGSAFLLDVRTPEEYAQGHMEGFVNIPLNSLRNRLDEIPKGVPVYATCAVGLRGYIACRMLSQRGFDAANVAGGMRLYDAWERDKQAQEAAAHA